MPKSRRVMRKSRKTRGRRRYRGGFFGKLFEGFQLSTSMTPMSDDSANGTSTDIAVDNRVFPVDTPTTTATVNANIPTGRSTTAAIQQESGNGKSTEIAVDTRVFPTTSAPAASDEVIIRNEPVLPRPQNTPAPPRAMPPPIVRTPPVVRTPIPRVSTSGRFLRGGKRKTRKGSRRH